MPTLPMTALQHLEALRQGAVSGHALWMTLWGEAVKCYRANNALEIHGSTVTYADLDATSSACTQSAYATKSFNKGSIVAIDTACYDFFQIALSVWQAGCVVLATDKQNPLTQSLIGQLADFFVDDSGKVFPNHHEPILNCNLETRAAWHSIFLTSGTTGQPKIIVRGWRQALFEGLSYAQTVDLRPGQRLGCLISPTFGAMTKQLIGGLISGCAQHFIGPDEAPCGHYDVLLSTPAHISALNNLSNLSAHAVSFTGEPLNPHTWHLTKSILSKDGYCLNAFGGTEFGVLANQHLHVHADLQGFYGQPLAGKELRIVTGDQPCQSLQGTPGKIGVRSAWLAEGEISSGNGDLSSSAIVFTPYPRDSEGTAYYQTQDFGLINTSGQLHVIGRASQMFKRHGQWFDLRPLEQSARAMPQVRGFSIDYRSDHGIAVWLELADESDLETINRQFLERFWQTPLLPRSVAALGRFPRNRNGKIDHATLKKLAAARLVTNCHWLDAIAEWLAGNKLPFPWVDGATPFARLALDSLDIIHLRSSIEHRINRTIAEDGFLPHRTLQEISDRLLGVRNPNRPLATLGEPKPSSASVLYWVGDLPSHLSQISAGRFQIYPVNPNRFLYPRSNSPESLKQLGVELAHEIRRIHKANIHRRVYVAGYSFGATLAHEIACQLSTDIPLVRALLVDPMPRGRLPIHHAFARLKHLYYISLLGLIRHIGLNQLNLIAPHLLARTQRRQLLNNHQPSAPGVPTYLWTTSGFAELSLPEYQHVSASLIHYPLTIDNHLALMDQRDVAEIWIQKLCNLILEGR